MADNKPALLGPLRAVLNDRCSLIVLLGILVGIGKGLRKIGRGEPEWSYWERVATQSWRVVGGPEEDFFGYLPSFAVLIKGFFAPPLMVGAFLFALVNTASCVGLLALLRAEIWKDSRRLDPCLAFITGVTMMMSLQNNQVVATSVFLAVLAFVLIQKNAWLGSVALAIAVIIKTLPATLFLLLALTRRFRLGLLAVIVLLVVSVGVSAIPDGLEFAVDVHVGFPAKVRAQDPNRLLTEGVAPRAFKSNMSVAAAVVRLAPSIGRTPALILNRSIFFATLILASCLSFVGIRRGVAPVSILALWLAWTIFATPFGRYYYLLFLLPAWWVFWPKDATRPLGIPAQIALWMFALSPLVARSSNYSWYQLFTVVTFCWCVYHCSRGPAALGTQDAQIAKPQ